MEQQQPS